MKRIDDEERHSSSSKTTSKQSDELPWFSLMKQFRTYLDFKVSTADRYTLCIENHKGEAFFFHQDAGVNIVEYKHHDRTLKVWKFSFFIHQNVMFKEIDTYYRENLQNSAYQKEIKNTWSITAQRAFTQQEIQAVAKTKVVKSQYGLSVEFQMSQGGVTYLPLYSSCSLPIDSEIDMTRSTLLTLSKHGEKDIYQVKTDY